LDHHEDVAKPKFTFTECIAAIILSLAIVTMLAVFLVVRIEDVVEAGIPDQFLGLIMLPLVEKAAEHLTAVDEAWDGQIVSHTASRVATEIELHNQRNRCSRPRIYVRSRIVRANTEWFPISEWYLLSPATRETIFVAMPG
jgi:hypothetical protein